MIKYLAVQSSSTRVNILDVDKCIYSAERWHKLENISHLSGIIFYFIFSEQVKDDSELDTRRAVTVVMTILSQFTERQHVITEYYEHWKVHVTTGKEFKSQWHQFVQEARKVSVNPFTAGTIFIHQNLTSVDSEV